MLENRLVVTWAVFVVAAAAAAAWMCVLICAYLERIGMVVFLDWLRIDSNADDATWQRV